MCDVCKRIPPDETCDNCFKDKEGNVEELCINCFEKKEVKLKRYFGGKTELEEKMSKLAVKTMCCNAEPYQQGSSLLCGKCSRDVTLEIVEVAKKLKGEKKRKLPN